MVEIDEKFIIENSQKVSYPCGIYFLVKDSKVVYVGKSLNVYARIREHKEFDFDKVFILPYDVNLLNKAEKYFIDKFSPPLNKHPGIGKTNYKSGVFFLNGFSVPRDRWEQFRQAAANVGKYEGDLLNMIISQYVNQVDGTFGTKETKGENHV